MIVGIVITPVVDVNLRVRTTVTRAELHGLSDYQKLIGGLIEAIPTGPDVSIFVHDEGKYLNPMARNIVAERIWKMYDDYGCLASGDWIAGPVVITGGVDGFGETKPLAERDERRIIDLVQDLMLDRNNGPIIDRTHHTPTRLA